MVISCKFAAYFRTPFPKNTSGWLLLKLLDYMSYDIAHAVKDELFHGTKCNVANTLQVSRILIKFVWRKNFLHNMWLT